MEEPKKIESRIKRALKTQKTYTSAIDMNISLCAYAYCVMLSAYNELETSGITLTELSREEHEKVNPNPASRIFFDAAEATRKNLRELGLTLATLAASDEDEVSNLINEVNNVR